MNYKNFIYLITLLSFFLSCKNDINSKNQNPANTEDNNQVNYEADSSDIIIFNKIMDYAEKKKLSDKTLPEIEIIIAKYFLGTPYVAHTLEKEGEEHLVINLHELDCTTFVENVVSLSTCIKNKTTNFDDFCKTLIKFRYRNGEIDRYPSRLHYFTDWLLDNEKKQLITIVSNSFAEDDFDLMVNFMSTHPQYYKQLENDTFVKQIAEREKIISKAKFKFIPKQKLRQFEKNIQGGDIIAITTSINGLDIAHVGLAIFVDGRLHLFHASSKGKKVMISEKTLKDYLKNITKDTGIIVARLK